MVVGWFWKGNQLLEYINENSKMKFGVGWLFSIKFFTPIFLTGLLILNIMNEIKTPYEGYPTSALIYVGLLPVLLAPFIGAAIDKFTERS